jgi:hypothetical protein
LGALAREADPSFLPKRSIVSLSKMIEEYCDGRILDKGPVRMSNWETKPLTEAQLACESTDLLGEVRLPALDLLMYAE